MMLPGWLHWERRFCMRREGFAQGEEVLHYGKKILHHGKRVLHEERRFCPLENVLHEEHVGEGSA